MFIKPEIFKPFGLLTAAQSTRLGGASPAPFLSLNLGKSTADLPENVAENRRRFCGALGFGVEQLAWSHQVHGNEVLKADAPGGAEGFDALITNKKGVFLAVSVADCTPILVFDAKNNAIAAIHAGWRGTVSEIVAHTLQKMSAEFGTLGRDCYAFIGACIDECSFEVGEEVAQEFTSDFKRFDPEKGKYFIDLKKANAAQLLQFGIPEPHIEITPFSTVLHNDRFFSHRLEKGQTGRMMAVIGLNE